MKKFISYEKLSKKERRKIDRQKRTLWATDPVTRTVESRKVYCRARERRELRRALH